MNKLAVFFWIGTGWLLAAPSAAAEELRGQIVDGSGRPVEHVLIYVPDPSLASAVPSEPAVIDQKNYQFHPRLLPVVAGATVEFRNNDPDVHNVRSQSTIANFNFTLPSPGTSHRVRFPAPGEVRLLCNVHSQMSATIVVLPASHYAVTDAEGKFCLSGLPSRELSASIWYGGGVVRTVAVSGAEPVRWILEKTFQSAPLPSREPPIRSWDDVVRGVERMLRLALDRAAQGDVEAAKKAQDDAYYAYFEAKGMEVAINLNISSRRKSELEDMFWEIRKGLVDLSERREERDEVGGWIATLVRELEKDAAELARQGVKDSGWGSLPEAVPDRPAPPAPDRDHYSRVVRNVEGLLNEAHQEYAGGNAAKASATVKKAYFSEFHQVEMSLKARYYRDTLDMERRFSDLLVGAPPAAELRRRIDDLMVHLKGIVTRVTEQGPSPWTVFALSFNIIAREGFEAILIIGAIVAFLIRMGARHLLRAVYAGVALALLASVGTALVVHYTLSNTANEIVEGITLLAASAVLVYVSYWFISKAQAMQWQRFLMGKIQGAMGKGGPWTLGGIAFLAVFREGAETVLFYEGLRTGTPGQGTSIVLGFVAGCAALMVLYILFRMISMRLPLRPFFIATSAMLYLMAFLFAGQGVAELQEGGVVPRSDAWGWGVQGAFVLAAGIAVFFFMIRKKKNVRESVPVVEEVAHEEA